MFCPSCGFEYTQKTNYCKRCGESMSLTSVADAPKTGRWILVPMFCAVAAFSSIGMLMAFVMYNKLANRGLRGDELILPFMMGMMFTGAIAGLLIWQLARLVTAYQKGERNVVVERHYIRESPPAHLGATADPNQQAVEPPSVVEHTTRQFAGKNK
ncbi:MAG TPA: hypothetical protein VJZ77_19030 [Blastocatellia bacterium]|nr:hypothetical protein [Blastocatellia bacterium]